MFFEKPNEKIFKIDGVEYEMTNEAKNGHWNSKQQLVGVCTAIVEIIDPNSAIDFETYGAEKKKMIKLLKEFDKNYTKHKKKKGVHDQLSEFISTAFIPLVNVLESNYEFHKLEEIMKNDDTIPTFRFDALETNFCKFMMELLRILTEHGKLRQDYNIQRMLNLLKLKNWKENHPMCYYLDPLDKSIVAAREELLEMRARGLIMCQYRIENNEEM